MIGIKTGVMSQFVIPEEIRTYRQKVINAGSSISESNLDRLISVYNNLLPLRSKIEVLYISAADTVAGMDIPVINDLDGQNFTTDSNITKSVQNSRYLFSSSGYTARPHGLDIVTNKEMFFAAKDPTPNISNFFLGEQEYGRYGFHPAAGNNLFIDCPSGTRTQVAMPTTPNKTIVVNSVEPTNRAYNNGTEVLTSARGVISPFSRPYRIQSYNSVTVNLEISAIAWGLPLMVAEIQTLSTALNLW